jgi:uncharacterized repeat protein (TIGR01451 family)
MYDLSAGQERQITTDPSDQGMPDIYGDKVVWEDYRNGNGDIYLGIFSISLFKEVDKNVAAVGETLTYTITYTNETNQIYANLILTDVLPEGTSYVEGSATGNASYDSGSGTLSWQISSLGPYEEGSE